MGLFCQREEGENEIVIRFKGLWFLWILIFLLFLAYFFVKRNLIPTIGYLMLLVVIVYYIDTWRVQKEIKNAMKKDGVTFKGSKFSISNPLKAIIKKT